MSRWGGVLAAVACILTSCLVAACASFDSASPRAAAAGAGDPDEGRGVGSIEQALYRVSYRGIDGRGRLRLVLRQAAGEFRLDAADPFGRSLWSFATAGAEAVLLDHRESTYCRLEGAVAVDLVALSELPVRSLPRLLAGRLPAEAVEPLVPPRQGELELLDTAGRRWTARYDDGVLASWTLYEEAEPILWWQRRDEGGILSHRDGAQASWIRTASERIEGRLEAFEPPADYTLYRCTESDAGLP